MQPIKMTDEVKKEIALQILTQLANEHAFDGKIKIEKNIKTTATEKVVVSFTPTAITKILKLVANYKSEVAWHGISQRIDERHYLIKDILVYPQVVSGATVETDQEAYTEWMMELDDDVVNNMRFQGHSHVDFAVTPSAVDIHHQEEILATMDKMKDAYYIFMIINKKMSMNLWVYDMATNTKYDTNDIVVAIEGTDFESVRNTLKEADEIVVQEKKPTTYKSSDYGYNGYGYGYGTGYNSYYGYGTGQNQQSLWDKYEQEDVDTDPETGMILIPPKRGKKSKKEATAPTGSQKIWGINKNKE